jgi:hypothetical protein
MPSPFPGMDPYVETQWKTFHGLMISALTSALNRTLPAGLVAQMEEEVRVETLAGERLRGYGPDVSVVDRGPRRPEAPVAESAAVSAVIEPVRVPYRRAPIVVRSVRIVESSDSNKVVTAVELLSPWNKRAGRLNRDYRRKLRDLESGEVNWVEIDLLRGSRARLAVRWDDLPGERIGTYLVVAWRATTDEAVAWPIPLRLPLPAIQVPLREGEPDIALDLQQAFDRAWTDGPFRTIDYQKPLDPPLPADDAAWAARLVSR